jgi:hypothetical protein
MDGTVPRRKSTCLIASVKFSSQRQTLVEEQARPVKLRVIRRSYLNTRPILRKQPMMTKVFPAVLLIGNLGAAICYALTGDWKRALYWAASSVCIAAVTF